MTLDEILPLIHNYFPPTLYSLIYRFWLPLWHLQIILTIFRVETKQLGLLILIDSFNMWFSYIMTVNLFRERSDLFMSQLRSAVLKNLTISGGKGTRIQLSWCDLTTLATISFINFICSYRLTVTRRVSRVVHKLLSLPQHLVLNGFVFLELSFSA
jgi:hypothetical protein